MKKYVSLTFKITTFTTAVVLAVCVVLTAIIYEATDKLFLEMAQDHIHNESRLIGNDIENALVKLSNDMLVLLDTPPIQGIVRSISNDGKDKLDHSTLVSWEDRLSKIFESMLRVNPNYSQIRYIGLANNGKELVRVDQKNQRIYRVHSSALQEKSERAYFKLGSSSSRGSISFSDIDYNIEHGKREDPAVVTMRVVTPVYTEEQIPFGMLLINVNIVRYLREILMQSNTHYDLMLMDQYDNFFLYNHEKETLEFTKDFSLIKDHFLEDSDVKSLKDVVAALEKDKNRITVFQPIYSSSHKDQRVFTAIISLSKSRVRSDEISFVSYVMLCVFGVCLLSALLIFIFSRRAMSPLSEMARALETSTSFSVNENLLPTQLNDEVGLLARAFKQRTRLLNKLALYDSLTGLPNRKSFLDTLEESLYRAKKNDQEIFVAFIDVNGFKEINDNYGHDYGDELLVKIAKKMSDKTRKGDYCARLGGDEFALIVKESKAIDDLFYGYHEALNSSYQIKGVNLNVTISGGVAICPADGISASELLMKADQAMYASKKEGKGRFIYFKDL